MKTRNDTTKGWCHTMQRLNTQRQINFFKSKFPMILALVIAFGAIGALTATTANAQSQDGYTVNKAAIGQVHYGTVMDSNGLPVFDNTIEIDVGNYTPMVHEIPMSALRGHGNFYDGAHGVISHNLDGYAAANDDWANYSGFMDNDTWHGSGGMPTWGGQPDEILRGHSVHYGTAIGNILRPSANRHFNFDDVEAMPLPNVSEAEIRGYSNNPDAGNVVIYYHSTR